MRRLSKIYRVLLCLLPAILYFSYYPVISLGQNESMNLELSVPLLWLVVFDAVALILMGVRGRLIEFVKKWYFVLFPIFASLSIIWSSNVLRGVLTAGVMWLVYVAIFAMVMLRDELDMKFRRVALKVFLGTSLVVCAWCLVQCILDLAGVERSCSLLCAGCVSEMFGFPHPNGFAIEPQFMGNLLLAPTIVAGFLMCRSDGFLCSEKHVTVRIAAIAFVFVSTLFLTFSRGAIYAFIVAMLFMTGVFLARRKEQKGIVKRVLAMWGVVVLSFVFTLNLQGVMTELGPTTDTYQKGITKALNHLSLDIIPNASAATEPVFDGYVAESTEIRKMMTENAIKVWSESPQNMLFGVGLGGSGEAMYSAGLTSSPKEIVQNQYASLLVETGVLGVALIVVALVLVLRELVILAKKKDKSVVAVVTMMVAYAVSLCFFAGLPNALQVYLMPAWVEVIGKDKNATK